MRTLRRRLSIRLDSSNIIEREQLSGSGRSFSAQVRSHGKPGQVGEPGAPVPVYGGGQV
jgi:hypothetical protein